MLVELGARQYIIKSYLYVAKGAHEQSNKNSI